MNKLITIFLTTLIILLSFSVYSQRTCGTTVYLNHQQSQNPLLKQQMKIQEKVIQEWIDNSKKSNEEIVYIPVIFHVLYNNSTTNINDQQIYSQIDILNDDYSRNNADSINTPAMFDSLAADIRIQFCVSHQTPDGDWTNGITRTSTTKSTFELSSDEAKFDSKGGIDAWDTEKYLNIWIVPEIVEGGMTNILGYAQMPGGSAATDGVVVGYNYIGNIGTVSSPFDKGRTLTHEIGHYFSLYHIWGDDFNACTGSDFVDDTPNQASNNFGCPTHPHASCSNNGDMFQNYMDYTDDDCMNLFTIGQKDRMLAALNTQRSTLITSGMCQAIYIDKANDLNFSISPNPASSTINIRLEEKSSSVDILITDVTGRIIMTATTNNNEIIINTSSFPNGIYFLQMKDNTKLGIQKFIIQQ